MTNKETVNRSIGLSFDFMRQIVNSSEIIDKIEDNSIIEFLQKDYSEREKPNRIIAQKYIKVKRHFELI